ncbi:MAG: hypothetical protein A3K19_22880 [Lentisphaerae bacterium RIFOXYB12_FULL_65_16]|nr:MAG: hypothetical protein A3K18_16875 [Lentisphaerae bacterium RIFOXYA12_64_32]OGV90054.1 MAG: hypothetical protein A3K19_22880 [Lentisphaerae bacterium RIFOXYB12_FULL_65_16]
MSSTAPIPEGREFPRQTVDVDVVVVGAGPAGICAALAAARSGAKTALVTDRPVLGGSASSEVRVTPSGADSAPWNRFARETGIMDEMSLRLAHKTQASGIWRWIYYDELYFDMVAAEPNLRFFLNTSIFKVTRDGANRIRSVEGVQLRSEKFIEFTGKVFIDCSGDGVVGFLGGAEYRVGREAKSEFNEKWAPETADRRTMGATLLFSSIDRGHPVPFQAPAWALDVRELRTLLDPAQQVARGFYRMPDNTFYGLWWAEYGGAIDSIHDDDDVLWHTRRLVYGLWDYIKNSGKFPNVERLELDWLGYLPGKRESRRLVGPYMPNANEFLAQKEFEDTIGFAGWPVDIHPPQGYCDPMPGCTHDYLPGITDIPFRCLYSRNIENLLFAGRNISVSHEGLGVLRVIATTAVMGQAAGTAAAYGLEAGLSPDAIRREHMPELQRRLARQDQSLTGYRLLEKDDASRTARVTASSECRSDVVDGTQWLTLAAPAGLVLPVEADRLDSISFHLHAYEETSLRLRVYACDKPHNYRLQAKVAEQTQRVTGDGWVTFTVNAVPGAGRKLFFVLDKNPKVLLRYATTRLTGVLGLQFPDVAEYSSQNSFSCLKFTPCFRVAPEQRLFRAENVIDGHIRPHGLPHCWASAPLDAAEPAWLDLAFPAPRELRSVELVFNADLNTKRHDVSGMYPELVKDYDVLADVGGKTVCLVKERGNILRFRRHAFAAVSARSLRLVVYATWGRPHAEVFDVRAYG